MKGHQENYENIKYKDGDSKKYIVQCKNNDRLLIFSSLGKFYTINCSKINTGRGFGDPISIYIDKSDNEDLIFLEPYYEDEEYLIFSSAGKGFFVSSDNLISLTKSGKKVMNLKEKDKAISCNKKFGDSVAIFSGEKKSIKLLSFDHCEIPNLNKGTGVILQKFKSGKSIYAQCYESKSGLKNGFTDKIIINEKEIKNWRGKRAQSGKIQPRNALLKLLN